MLFAFEIFLSLLVGAVLLFYILQLQKRQKLLKDIPGPMILPIFGNLLEYRPTPENIHELGLKFVAKYGKLLQLWYGPVLHVITSDPKITEKFISSTKHIDKGWIYRFGVPFLQDGLLLSTGEKWQKRRKMLTPAFHFAILEQCPETFDNASNLLVKNLERHADGKPFDISTYITLCTLDIICETAMGIKVNAQTESKSVYVYAVRDALNSLFDRVFCPWQYPDFIFNNFTKNSRKFYQSLKILHDATAEVIQTRRAALMKSLAEKDNAPEDFGQKKRSGFLDVLLQATIDGKPLSDMDIQEEVNTFMFEGHDTVASALGFILYLLANHPEIQEKVYREVKEVLGDDPTRIPTLSDFNNMKYLELVIKESLRLYPSVPAMARTLTEDFELDSVVIPKGTQMVCFIYAMHHDSDNFPDAETFKPERFMDSSENKSHFAYIPFSAGPRNCIGQKFAMYEMKSTISKIIRNYEVISAGPEYKLKLTMAIILKSMNGINIKIRKRNL